MNTTAALVTDQHFIMNIYNAIRDMVNNPLIHIFSGAILFDVITGFLASFVTKKTNSTTGLKGLFKHLIVLIMVTAAYPYLSVLHFEGIAETVLIFYITIYAVSIVENLGKMGIPLPDIITSRLLKLKDDKGGKQA